MKTLKLLGIIALSALIIIWAAGCEGLFGPVDPDGGDDYLEGELTIKMNGDGPYVGVELEAMYTGYENISYEWFRDSVSLVVGTTGTQKKYTPQQTGSYTVKIKCLDFDDEMFAKNPINILAAENKPAYSAFLGTWKMTGADNGGWLGGYTTGNVIDETIVLTSDSFRCDSTHPGTSNNGGNTPNAPNEFVSYTITSWDVYSGTLSGYTTIYKLTVSNPTYKGYTPTTGNAIYLYMNSAGNLFWGNNITTSGSTVTHNIWASRQNPITGSNPPDYYPRKYVKQQN
jgi:hypothetical protein